MKDLVERGYKAKVILDFAEVWKTLEEDTTDQLLHSRFQDVDKREMEYQRFWALRDLQELLAGWYEEAKAIEKQNSLTHQ